MEDGGKTLFEPITQADLKQAQKIYLDNGYIEKTNTIQIDKKAVKESFNQKRWTKPRIKGVKKLPAETFTTPDQWYNYVLLNNVARATNKKLPNESTAKYINRINRIALEMYEDRVENLMTTLPIKDEYDIALPNLLAILFHLHIEVLFNMLVHKQEYHYHRILKNYFIN